MKREPDNKKKEYKNWALIIMGAMVIGLIIIGIPGLLLGGVIGLIVVVILEIMSGKKTP